MTTVQILTTSTATTEEKAERRPISADELALLADAWRNSFPELRWCTPGEVLERWQQIADAHRILVEHRRPVKNGDGR